MEIRAAIGGKDIVFAGDWKNSGEDISNTSTRAVNGRLLIPIYLRLGCHSTWEVFSEDQENECSLAKSGSEIGLCV